MEHKTARTLKFTVAFDEADGEGIVFFGNYFRLAHRAFEQYIPLLGIPWKEWFSHPDWGVPLRHVECDYFQPMRPGQEFTVTIQVESLGESSAHFIYEFKDAGGKSIAKLKTSHVFASRKDFQKIKLPDGIRARLS